MNDIIAVNAGSSSIKLSIFSIKDDSPLPNKDTEVQITAARGSGSEITIQSAHSQEAQKFSSKSNNDLTLSLCDWLETNYTPRHLLGVGHRFVYGGPNIFSARLLDQPLVAALSSLVPFDPDHLPSALRLYTHLQQLYHDVPHIACFDTEFFKDLPRIAQLLALPRQYESLGLRRYGFHGLSYDYLMDALRTQYGEACAAGKIVLAHLGSGSSLASLMAGRPIDTTMGFSPASGIMMSSRSGDLDPGIGWFLYERAGVDEQAFNKMINTQSGLLGVSGLSSDMRVLLEREVQEAGAAEAVALYCYQVRKAIGALVATLDGLDTLVFAGGIGEQSSIVRQRICDSLGYLGVSIDPVKNSANTAEITGRDSTVRVLLMKTDENQIIARDVVELLDKAKER